MPSTGRLAIDANGNVHGTTTNCGDPTCQCGVVYRLDPSGHETVIHTFFGNGGGAFPEQGVIDVGAILYGATTFGGDPSCQCGVLYQIWKTGVYSVLHRFTGSPDDFGFHAAPKGDLSLNVDGSIYGANAVSFTQDSCEVDVDCGFIFKLTP